MRYIDAEELTDYMLERYNELCDKHGDYDHYTTGYGDAIDAIENAPTADVVPRAEAVWNQSKSKFGFGQSNCSVCNGYVEGYTSYRFCPHCGAKIVGIKETNGEAE